jgi:hypothetical protein
VNIMKYMSIVASGEEDGSFRNRLSCCANPCGLALLGSGSVAGDGSLASS